MLFDYACLLMCRMDLDVDTLICGRRSISFPIIKKILGSLRLLYLFLRDEMNPTTLLSYIDKSLGLSYLICTSSKESYFAKKPICCIKK